MSPEKTEKYLQDAIPRGDHPAPWAEWVPVRLDVVLSAIDLAREAKRKKPVGLGKRLLSFFTRKQKNPPDTHTGTAQSEGWP